MKKPGLMLAIGVGKPKGGSKSLPEAPKSEPEMESGGFDAAFSDFADAMESGDREAAKAALKLAVMECMNEYE